MVDQVELDEDESDDLPETELPPALTEGLDWDKLDPGPVKWPASLGEPPEGLAVEIIEGE
jgi:hypothetical protein